MKLLLRRLLAWVESLPGTNQPLRRVVAGWEGVRERLRPFQLAAQAGTVLVVLALSATFGYPLVQALRRKVASDPSDERIGLTDSVAIRGVALVEPSLGGEAAGEAWRGAAASSPERSPAVAWRSEEALRRAASLLLLKGYDEDAAALLSHGGGEDAGTYLAANLDPQACSAIRAALGEVVREEAGRLRAFWSSRAGARRRSAIFSPGEDASPAGVYWVLSQRDASLADFATKLPDALLLPFVSNVHLELARRTAASDALLSLVLEGGFPPGSLARRTYIQRPPRQRRDYTGA